METSIVSAWPGEDMGESPFLTMTRLSRPRIPRIGLNFWGTLAIEIALLLAVQSAWSHASSTRAATTSEQIESDGVRPSQPVESPTQQAS